MLCMATLAFALCFSPALHAQSSDDLLENAAQESGASPQLDLIEYYSEHPLYLRKATSAQVAALPTFTPALARKIISIAKNPATTSIQIIADSLDLSLEQRSLLERCCTLEEPTAPLSSRSARDKMIVWRVRNNIALNEQSGFTNNSFQGSPLDVYQRLSFNSSWLQANVITNKDAGEQSLAEFVSGYTRLQPLNGTTVILGDFYVESGAGSILWKNFGARKGPDVIAPPTQFGSGVLPYRSTLDYRFFRGIAAEQYLNMGKESSLTLRLWYSQLPRTASIDSATNTISSLDIDGQYRTSSEIAKRNSTKETTVGGIAEWSPSSAWKVGASVLSLAYDREVVSASSSAFLGKSGVLAALYGMYSSNSTTLISELARDAKNNLAFKAGAEFNTKAIAATLFVRSYAADFRSPFGYNFGEYVAPNNESGVYTSLLWRAAKGVQLLSYIDIYRSSVPRYGLVSPTRGFDCLNELRWKINRNTSLFLRYRYENKTDAVTAENIGAQSYQQSKSLLRLEVQQQVNDVLSVRLRLEASGVDYEDFKPRDEGYAGFMEAHYQVQEWLKIGGRYSLYSTDGFNAAIYQYELVAPGLFSTIPVYDNGMRSYFYLKVNPLSSLALWMRYAVTTRNNLEALSSGVTQIQGQSEQRIMLQLDFQW